MAEKKTTAATKKTTAAKTATKTTAVKAPAAEKAPAVKKTTAAKKTAMKKTTTGGLRPPRTPQVETTPVAPVAPIRKTISKRTTVRKAAAGAAPAAGGAPKSGRRTKVGMVVSAKSLKTVIVDVERMRQHPLYRKALRVGTRYAAHTENGEVLAGDLVRIQESRPYSATKRWKVIEVLSRAGEAGAAAPRVADVESQLEQQEGVTELLSKPVQAESDSADATSQAGDESPEGDMEGDTKG